MRWMSSGLPMSKRKGPPSWTLYREATLPYEPCMNMHRSLISLRYPSVTNVSTHITEATENVHPYQYVIFDTYSISGILPCRTDLSQDHYPSLVGIKF
jgi:hypothetical protein